MINQSLATLLQEHVTLELESLDLIYLNLYVPKLQTEAFAASFFKKHRGALFASSALMEPMSTAFRHNLDRFVEREHVPVVCFARGQRKDDIAKQHLALYPNKEGVLFVGKAEALVAAILDEWRHRYVLWIRSQAPPLRIPSVI